MTRKNKNVIRNLDVPWITKDGYLDLTKLPIDSTLTQAVGNNTEEFRSACLKCLAPWHPQGGWKQGFSFTGCSHTAVMT